MNVIAARLSGIGLVALATIGITVAWYGTVRIVEKMNAARCLRWVTTQSHVRVQTKKGR